jgi:hypothetical protein
MKTKGCIICIFACIMILLAGCATTCKPEIVTVPVPVYADPLPIPDVPVWETPDADPSVPSTYIRALVHDLLESWTWASEMRHVIESHNKAIADEQP